MLRFLSVSLHLHSCPAVSWDEQLGANGRKLEWSVMKRVPATRTGDRPEPCPNGSGTGDVVELILPAFLR